MNWNDREIRLKMAATATSTHTKNYWRDRLQRDIDRYLRKGGQIIQVPHAGAQPRIGL